MGQTLQFLPYFTYGVTDLTKREWEKDVIKHYRLHGKLKNNLEFISLALYRELILKNYGFQIEIVNDKPRGKEEHSLIKLTLNYCSSSPITTYMHNDMIYMHEANSMQFSIYKPRS